MNENRMKKILKAVNSYLVFFLVIAFATTCCMMLFLSVFAANLNFDFTRDNLDTAARLTFGNVVLLTLVYTVVDFIRRKITVERPVKQIADASEKIMKGDFDFRLDLNKFSCGSGFDEIARCFNEMAEALSSTETLKTDFIANVSHELKTPLTVIQNYSRMLRQPDISDEKRLEYSKAITESCGRLDNLISNILKLNKLENQTVLPKTEEFRLDEQLAVSILEYESIWESKEIDIETDIEDNITVCADGELLGLVWKNLLSNAFKFTEKGGKVSVSLTADKDFAVVKIRDTGCGIDPKIGSRIFEKFYQGDTSRSTAGNGLGLALVKRIVDITKSEINVESILGKGSEFAVKIRRAGDEQTENNMG